jgi:hypothetical protein
MLAGNLDFTGLRKFKLAKGHTAGWHGSLRRMSTSPLLDDAGHIGGTVGTVGQVATVTPAPRPFLSEFLAGDGDRPCFRDCPGAEGGGGMTLRFRPTTFSLVGGLWRLILRRTQPFYGSRDGLSGI